MKSSGQSLVVRAATIVASLAGIFAALEWMQSTAAIWNATLVAVAAFYVLAHLAPRTIFRLQSMPYTYQLHNNVGPRGFELQNVTYAAYHTHWYNRATHAAFPVEAWLWFVVAAHFGGPAASWVLAIALAAQSFSFGERGFALGSSALWLAFAASANGVVSALGPAALGHAQAGLVAFGFWRFSGHWVEPLPPGVVGNRAFVPLDEAEARWRVLPAAALGYLSEFSAGLPFRLVNSWLFLIAQRLGYRPRHALPHAATEAIALRIHCEGWGAQPTTAAIVVAAHELPASSEPSAPRVRVVAARSEKPEPARALSSGSIRLMACDEGASVWLIAIGGRTILFDTWLDDPYISGSRAFFSAHRLAAPVIAADQLPALDAIVLSSAEQDHCHPRTLARLDKRVPVFAASAAAHVASAAGFERVTLLPPGTALTLCGGEIGALAMPGYGRNSAVVLCNNRSGERVCIAQHGIQPRWLARNAERAFRWWPFAPGADGCLVDTLCLGVHTTLLRPPGVPPALLGSIGTILPDPSESAAAISLLSPRRVLFSHCTVEAEKGFAVRHLLKYPTADDDLGYASRVLGERCPGVAIEGLPAPGRWV
jgi:hypothetical protein